MKDALTTLAFDAVSCLLAQIPVSVTHADEMRDVLVPFDSGRASIA